MEFRIVTKRHKLHFSFERTEQVKGVNSRVDAETHFLMWDFDNVPLPIVEASLKEIQNYYDLPKISIISTGKADGFHAYCFKACSFLRARTILASTPYVDTKFVALGLLRGYFTLRFSDVKGRRFSPVCELASIYPEDLSYSDVNSFVNYTKRVK